MTQLDYFKKELANARKENDNLKIALAQEAEDNAMLTKKVVSLTFQNAKLRGALQDVKGSIFGCAEKLVGICNDINKLNE